MLNTEKVRSLRVSKRLSQDRMAEKLGISTTTYARMERGESTPNLSVLESMAQLLGVQYRWFAVQRQQSGAIQFRPSTGSTRQCLPQHLLRQRCPRRRTGKNAAEPAPPKRTVETAGSHTGAERHRNRPAQRNARLAQSQAGLSVALERRMCELKKHRSKPSAQLRRFFTDIRGNTVWHAANGWCAIPRSGFCTPKCRLDVRQIRACPIRGQAARYTDIRPVWDLFRQPYSCLNV